MAVDPPIKPDIEYLKIFSSEAQNIPAWRDLAETARQILGAEVDDRRRKLQKIRDSVKYRRGDVLVNVDYEPDPQKPMVDAITQEPFVWDGSDIQFRTATVMNVIQNLNFFKNQSATNTDYVDLEVKYKGRLYRWLKPFLWTQERDILLKNAYMLGFNFFNTKLSDQDLQRVVEFIQIYWNEAGADDNFMKFIGFIKNQRFELVPLWTEGSVDAVDTTNAGDTKFQYPYLKQWDDSMSLVTDGGKNWLTSHVDIKYDLAQFTDFYTINLDDLEQLFYYFAPIILVLDKVIGYLEVDTPLIGMDAVTVSNYHYSVLKPSLEFIIEILALSGTAISLYHYSMLNVDRESCLGLDAPVNLSQDCFDFAPYLVAAGA